jgi:hypothetical protein
MPYSATDTEVKATRVWVENGQVCIQLADEREMRFPATKNPRLRKGAPEQVAHVEIICAGAGLHWPDLDEDLSVQGIIEGRLGA